MQFTKLTKDNINLIKDFFTQSENSFCDLSVGAKYMWRYEYSIDFCVLDDTLIMKEDGPDYNDVFYYPIGKNLSGALDQIENYCREKFIPLEFCCIEDKIVDRLSSRYKRITFFDEQDWNDYIYTAEQFKTYAGKKLSGQRNHVNRFKKLYPEYSFKKLTTADLERVGEFLDEYKSSPFLSQDAREEVELTRDYITVCDSLNQVGGYLEVDGKIVALSVGEVVGDTLIVHVEKGLTAYSGVYPTMAQEFAKAFAGDGVVYINREEDCGDEGLRRSKTQYHPIEIRKKNCVIAHTLFDGLNENIFLESQGLIVKPIEEKDMQKYYELYTDDHLNKWWGYDYREDLDGQTPSPEYFYGFQKKMKERKEEFSFAVCEKGNEEMVGELVLHNFDYFGGVEIGFRFFREYQGKGYATISATMLKEYLFNTLGAEKLKSRCYKENTPSRRLIERLGLTKTHEDQTHYYFEIEKTAIAR